MADSTGVTPRPKRPRIVIVGGGFGGLNAAKGLKDCDADVVLVDRRNFHLFQPLLYQVATGGLSPGDITSPLRAILKRHDNTEVIMAEVIGFDLEIRQVRLEDGQLEFDFLVVATGARHTYFGNDHWAHLAPGLKTIEDAIGIRTRIFAAFEAAEREKDLDARNALMTFVIVGGGPTGVELAGALAEIAGDTLRRDFRHIDSRDSKIFLIEGGERVLQTFPRELSIKAQKALERMNVCVKTDSYVVDVTELGVTVKMQSERYSIPARTVLWAAGVKGSSLGTLLVGDKVELLDVVGRVKVEPDLSLTGHPEVFVVGDLALYGHQDGLPLPGVAPVAISQGKYVASLLRHRLKGQTYKTYHYRDKGTLATIGRAAAVADFRFLQLSGYLAWLLWTFVHLMYLVGFENRLMVFLQWTWSYITKNRGARLITGELASEKLPDK